MRDKSISVFRRIIVFVIFLICINCFSVQKTSKKTRQSRSPDSVPSSRELLHDWENREIKRPNNKEDLWNMLRTGEAIVKKAVWTENRKSVCFMDVTKEITPDFIKPAPEGFPLLLLLKKTFPIVLKIS